MAINSAVVLVGDEDETLTGLSTYLSERSVAFVRASGITDAIAKVADSIAAENARRSSRNIEPIEGVSTVDFVGHATQGRFLFGAGDVLNSCPDSYSRLYPLRTLITPPADPKERWGLRLIGADISNDHSGSYARDNGIVLQFALSWFLQMPIWAPIGAIFRHHFENPDGRVPFEYLAEVSLSTNLRVPRRFTEDEFERQLRQIFRPTMVAPKLQTLGSSTSKEFYEFDFSNPTDASDLLGKSSKEDEIFIPAVERGKFRRATSILGGKVLLVELATGEHLAYFRRKNQ